MAYDKKSLIKHFYLLNNLVDNLTNRQIDTMSVVVRIYSNHDLLFDNYHFGVKLIEDLLQINISDINNKKTEVTNNNLEACYFTNHDYFARRFSENWGIWVFSNFRLCDQFIVHKHFVQFSISGNINLKTHIWRKLITKQKDYFAFELWTLQGFNEVLVEWNDTRKYITKITKALGGDAILYLNDGYDLSFGGDLVYEGVNTDDLFSALYQVSEPIDYKSLEDDGQEFYDKNWFIEKI